MKTLILTIILSTVVTVAHADCVFGAKNKTSYVVVDSNTIILKGYGSDILIKTYSYISSFSNVMVLKDSFCSYGSNVLLIDGSPASVSDVTSLN